jgi:heme exporter protein A
LINPAKLWILDEPFTTLDSSGVAQLENLLRQHADAGGSVLVTTHHKLTVAELEILSLG